MTPYEVSRSMFSHFRSLTGTFLIGVRAPVVKPATGRRIYRAWNFALQQPFFALKLRVGYRVGSHQEIGVRMGRMVENGVFLAHFDDFSHIHDCYPVGYVIDQREIMGYEHISQAFLRPYVL